MKVSLKKTFKEIFFSLYLLIFFLSGVLQFFFGIPYVIISFLITIALLYVVLLYFKRWDFTKIDFVFVLGTLYSFLIIISGIINQSDVIHVFLYLLFPILPLAFHLFTKIGIREKILYKRRLSLILMYTACVQFPFIIGQRLSYNFMKGFNNSGQQLIEVDFWFGTFPFKADHALGVFMLFNILNIYWNNKKLNLTKYPWIVMGWIAVTVFFTDTKITQLIIALLLVLHTYLVVPKKIKIIGIVFAALTFFTAIFFLQKIPILKSEYEYSQKAYTLKHTKSTYKSGVYARRLNIVIYYTYFRPLTFIGEGPYDYFDFRRGRFKKTHHFSQLIWTYNDLGLIGLITVILFMYFLVKSLALTWVKTWLIFIILMIYAFMTVALFDFALIISLLLIVNNRFLDEPDSDTLS